MEIGFTTNDLERIRWQELLSSSETKECWAYGFALWGKARESEAAGDSAAAKAYKLLGDVSSMRLDVVTEPPMFRPFTEMEGQRSAALEDFSDADLKIFSTIVESVRDPEMRARMADVLWLRSRDHKMAELAVDSYIESASVLEDPEAWPPFLDRVTRAMQISASLGKKNTKFQVAIQFVERTLDKYDGHDPLYLSERLMRLLYAQRVGDLGKYAELAGRVADQAASEKKWDRSRAYREMEADWHRLNQLPEAEHRARILAAETLALKANETISEGKKSLIATMHLQQALEALRRARAPEERIQAVHKQLLDIESRLLEEMTEISGGEIDVTGLVDEARGRVSGKPLPEAILALVLTVGPPNAQSLRTSVIDAAGKFVLQSLVPRTIVDRKGKTIATRGNLLGNNEEEREDAIRAEMITQAVRHQEMSAYTAIDPIRKQILLEHFVRVSDFGWIVENSPVVPPGREKLFSRGLHAGMVGDFVMATSILVPQFEESLRNILTSRGFVTSGMDTDGVQEEMDLGRTLAHPEIKRIFGENTVFDLQGLLVEKVGTNLRNRIAHGLMDYSDFHSLQCLYAWWSILRICVIPLLSHAPIQAAESSEDHGIGEDIPGCAREGERPDGLDS